MSAVRVKRAALLVAGAALVAVPAPRAHSETVPPGAILTHPSGLIRLGVTTAGSLDVKAPGNPSQTMFSREYHLEGGNRIYDGVTWLGLRYRKPGVPGEFEYTAEDIKAEGWGLDMDGVTAYADEYGPSYDGGTSYYGGFTLVSFTVTPTTAVSVVDTNGSAVTKARVTHDFHPSTHPNLYECSVTIENTGTAPIAAMRYRRLMDWDMEPTPFNEVVTLQGWPNADLLHMSNDGFLHPDPTVDPMDTIEPLEVLVPDPSQPFDRNVSSVPMPNSIVFTGPGDQGGSFDFALGSLGVGESVRFKIFYGAADSISAAQAALSSVGATVYSLCEPNVFDPTSAPNHYLDGKYYGDTDYTPYIPPTSPLYTVAVFGFLVDVSCTPVRIVPDATSYTLWPPNHKYVDVKVLWHHEGGCPSTGADVECEWLSVVSDEPENAKGDGNTTVDWIARDEHTLRLRSERQGMLGGRTYTATLRCTDAAGNVDTEVFTIEVPKSQAK